MDLFAKKSLGQHFLNSRHVLEQIIKAADIKKAEIILEIGPGTGVLTEALLSAGANVKAVEKDERAISLLTVTEKFKNAIGSEGDNKLELIRGDILELDRKNIGLNEGGYAVVANIPYYITGAILESFLQYEPRPSRMILLVQKEVADRIVARDGKESILSISVKAFGTPTIELKVPPGAFTPPPTVDSAVLAIRNISNAHFKEQNISIDRFFQVLKTGFAHKRKLLKSNLKPLFDESVLNQAWQRIGLNEKARAEDLALDQWLKIAAK